MKLLKIDYLFLLFIFAISSLFVLELFLFPGRPATFDANTHITTLAQFSQAIKSGDFPIVWLNNFANYGLPVGIFTHQLTNYVGGTITLLTQNPVLTYNILVFIAIFLSGVFLYLFLRLYFKPLSSFLGVFIFTFTQYRIFDIYVRGAMPEVFSGIFLPLILISLYSLIVKRKTYAFFLISLFIAGLTLNHPMMLVVYSILFIPYLFFLLFTNNLSKMLRTKLLIITASSMLLGLLISSYYVLPLNLELKYFYNGLGGNHLIQSSYLSLSSFFITRWNYFLRGDIIQFGLLETLILISGFLYYFYKKLIQKSKENLKFLELILFLSVLIIFFTTPFSNFLYEKVFFLNSLQFPSRFLSSLIILPPILIAYFYDKFPKKIFLLLIVILVCIFSFPQIYGKDFTAYPLSSYYFSKENAYSVMMNTIWTGKTEDYPDKNPQGEIISGKGKIINETLKNSSRRYTVDASTSLTMVDHTFYFPGWNVYVDGVKTNIEYQNPKYRGVITYQVSQGKHFVYLVFQDTKVRLLGKILSVAALILLFGLFFFRNKISKLIKL
jgi:uncharacterized membrane protein